MKNMKSGLKIEAHVIQNVAPSCLNRGEEGAPKSAVFGGTPRGRVSSQSWKFAMRQYWEETEQIPLGVRTKHLHSLLQERLAGKVPTEVIGKFIADMYSKADSGRPLESAVLLYVSEAEITAMMNALLDGTSPRETVKALIAAPVSPDIALFGRMLAGNRQQEADGACQVGHALTVHAVAQQTDFFTAVDDLKSKYGDETGGGAAMLGSQQFNSACYYRYGLVNYTQLLENLKGDQETAHMAVEAFLRGFIHSLPSAKQTSMPSNNSPSFVMLRAYDRGVPVSLLNAYIVAIHVDGQHPDLMESSIRASTNYYAQMDRMLDLDPNATIALVSDREDTAPLGKLAVHNMDRISTAIAAVMERVPGGAS